MMNDAKTLPFLLVLLSVGWFCTPHSSYAKSKDRRLALLVANEEGWQGDPKLQYVISGDLRPLARALRGLGFEVKTIENRNASTVRRALEWVHRRSTTSPKPSTFLFYYSGHADRRHFHLGKRGRSPLTYREFAQRFRALPLTRKFAIFDSCFSGEIIRQFGSVQRYQKRLKKGHAKGVRGHQPINIKKLMLPEQGKEQGMRIISSSLYQAWELHSLRASIFTHHLLRGLRHAADLNRDGKITVDELFDFASREVSQQTGQQPQQLILVKRQRPYALAPAYYSRLWIGPKVVGNIRVKVGNFMWSKHKRQRQALSLAVVDGTGEILWKHQKQCWRQALKLPKGREIRVHNGWQKIRCQRWVQLPKGTLRLPARHYSRSFDASILPSPKRFVGLASGLSQSGASSLHTTALDTTLFFRWNLIDIAVLYRVGNPAQKTFWLSHLMLRGSFGWLQPFSLGRSQWHTYLGAFLQAGAVFLHAADVETITAPGLGAGAMAEVVWWVGQQIGLQLSAQIGADWTPTRGEHGFSLLWKCQVGLVFSV